MVARKKKLVTVADHMRDYASKTPLCGVLWRVHEFIVQAEAEGDQEHRNMALQRARILVEETRAELQSVAERFIDTRDDAW